MANKKNLQAKDLVVQTEHSEIIALTTLPSELSVDCDPACLLLKITEEIKVQGGEEVLKDYSSPWSFASSLHFGSTTSPSSNLQNLRSTQANLLANYRLTKKWELSTGLGYALFAGDIAVGGPEQVKYDFVARRTRYEWNLKNIHFLQIPLHISYAVKPRHEISFGFNTLFRLKTGGDLTIYKSTTLDEEVSNSPQNGVNFGTVLPSLNVQMGLEYGYRINSKVTMGLSYYHGLQDMINDGFSVQKGKERASFAKVFFKYDLNR